MDLKLVLLVIIPLCVAKKTLCPGGKFSCPQDLPCCELTDSSFGCCVVKNGVCCEDKIHCCPQNTKCSNGECIKSYNQTSLIAGLKLIPKDVTCPDVNSTCPDETTCCKSPQFGTYNCCPLPEAVCCNDGQHCCPSGTTCNLEEKKCLGDRYIVPMYPSGLHPVRLSDISIALHKSKDVVCPGSEFQCPNGYTCCKLPAGDWGCCPFERATCCKDGLHCCPENMHCDATSQYCSQVDYIGMITARRNKPAVRVKNTCPDKSVCKDTDTCCRISAAKFGCCHYANATCCNDGQHCCPQGYECDVKEKFCIPKRPLFV